jgi:cytochrome P450
LPFDKPATGNQLNQLKYLDQVIRESLRLYPPAHMGSRLAAQDLNFDGYLIPKGNRVIYSIYLTQRHNYFWERPHKFDPQRHEKRTTQTPYTWLAFGGGPRNCIGAAFGLMEAKVILTRVLQRFDLQLVSRNVRPHMGATLEPRPGVLMKITP